jgi:hypothetical protein
LVSYDLLPSPCATDSDCSPGEQCGPLGSSTCSAAVQGCCETGLGGGTFVQCCYMFAGDRTDWCWNPGDHR